MDDGASPPWPTTLVTPTLIVGGFTTFIGLANVLFGQEGNFGGFSVVTGSVVSVMMLKRARRADAPNFAAAFAGFGVALVFVMASAGITPVLEQPTWQYIAGNAAAAWAGCVT